MFAKLLIVAYGFFTFRTPVFKLLSSHTIKINCPNDYILAYTFSFHAGLTAFSSSGIPDISLTENPGIFPHFSQRTSSADILCSCPSGLISADSLFTAITDLNRMLPHSHCCHGACAIACCSCGFIFIFVSVYFFSVLLVVRVEHLHQQLGPVRGSPVPIGRDDYPFFYVQILTRYGLVSVRELA